MSHERWRRANTLFEALADLPADDQRIRLERECKGDPALRAEVERRLRADAEAGAFLRDPIAPFPSFAPDRAQRADPSARASAPDAQVLGAYRVLREIGRGGMGTVYAAERDDDAFHRLVAIKVVTVGTESEDVVRRLRTEQHILGLLEHPNIARIYDAGATARGFPFFVMEHVAGEPIDRYAEIHQLTIRDRAALITKVCAAVDYAHRNLVVHRDLKPSNILVTDDGTPKLLDFGIAKVLDARASPGTLGEMTVPWRQRLTLNYASPEQIRGQPVSTASDVYALGVLLYRLLTGTVPFDLEGLTPIEIEQRLAAGEPLPPSVAVAATDGRAGLPGDSRAATLELAGDLDSIVLKALRGEPEDRYRSAELFAEDIERYLRGFPVQARRGTFRYRAGKWFERHRVAASLVGLALTFGMLFVGSVVLSANRLARNQTRLLEEREKLEEVVAFFLGVFDDAGPYVAEGMPITVRDAVDRHAARLDGALEGQPAVLAAVLSTLGWVYLDLGLPQPAHTYHERAYRLRSALDRESLDVAESLDGVAAALREQWKMDQAAKTSLEAVSMVRRHENAGSRPLLRSLNNRVDLFCKLQDWSSADPLSAEAIALGRSNLDEDEIEVSKAMIQRALVLRNLGDVEGARDLYLETEKRYERRYGAVHAMLAPLYNNLGRLEMEAGRLAVAADYLRQADHQYEAAFGDDFYDRIIPLSNLGRVLFQSGDLAAAEAALRQGLDVAARSPALGPQNEIGYFGRAAVPLGRVLAASGRCPEALTLLQAKVASWQHKPKNPIVLEGGDVVRACESGGILATAINQ